MPLPPREFISLARHVNPRLARLPHYGRLWNGHADARRLRQPQARCHRRRRRQGCVRFVHPQKEPCSKVFGLACGAAEINAAG